MSGLDELRERAKKITRKSSLIENGIDDFIELDPNNPKHVEWYEEQTENANLLYSHQLDAMEENED